MGKNIVVVPAYNEEKTIGKVIKAARKYCEVIVVDDCSKDQTAAIAEKNGAMVIKNRKNLGYDAALNIGIADAASKNADIVILMDADGQHDANDIPAAVKIIEDKNADVVVGIRPYRLRISEKIYASFSRRKIGITDPLCGFKAFRVDAFKKIGYYDSIGSIGTEFMFAAKKLGYRLAQMPITLNERKDRPRFGDGIKIKAEMAIFAAMLKVMRKYGL